MNKPTKLNPIGFRWDPFREFEELQERLSSFFGTRVPLVKSGGEESETFGSTTWAPRVDITEDEKEYVVEAELPGMKKEEVKVTIENGVLSISGERKAEKEEKGKKHHRVERSYGSFTRSFTLPDTSSAGKVSADFKDGILKVHVPKSEKVQAKAIEVKVG
jgi:HSP20 family protein